MKLNFIVMRKPMDMRNCRSIYSEFVDTAVAGTAYPALKSVWFDVDANTSQFYLH